MSTPPSTPSPQAALTSPEISEKKVTVPGRSMRIGVMFVGSLCVMVVPFFLIPTISSTIGGGPDDMETEDAIRTLVMEQPQLFSGGLRDYAQDVGLGDARVQYSFPNGAALAVSEYGSESQVRRAASEAHQMYEARDVRERTSSFDTFVSYVFRGGEAAVVRQVGEYMVILEAPTKSALTETSRRLAQNDLTLSLSGSAIVVWLLGILGYSFWAIFFFMSWLARWATRVEPVVGALPVPHDELMRRLLTLKTSVPLTIEESGRTGILKVHWDYANAQYASLVEAGVIRQGYVIELKLYENKKEVRMIQQTFGLRAQGNVVKPALSASFSFFRGIIFGAYQYEVAYGPTIQDGRLVVDKLYEVKFSNMEIVKAVTAVVVQSGWALQPVAYRL